MVSGLNSKQTFKLETLGNPLFIISVTSRKMQPQSTESGAQLFSRLCRSSDALAKINPKLFEGGGPRPNEFIEIAGEFTEDLILDFLVRCILPKELNENWKESQVIFINTSHRVNIIKIANLIDAHLKNINIKNRKPIIEKALTFITFLNCYNQEQFEVTLLNLEEIMQNKNVTLLIIDDIVSQFWVVKETHPELTLQQLTIQTFGDIKDAVKYQNLVVVFSRSAFFGLKNNVNLKVDYKIIGEQVDSAKKFIVFDNKTTTKSVTFKLDSFITFI